MIKKKVVATLSITLLSSSLSAGIFGGMFGGLFNFYGGNHNNSAYTQSSRNLNKPIASPVNNSYYNYGSGYGYNDGYEPSIVEGKDDTCSEYYSSYGCDTPQPKPKPQPKVDTCSGYYSSYGCDTPQPKPKPVLTLPGRPTSVADINFMYKFSIFSSMVDMGSYIKIAPNSTVNTRYNMNPGKSRYNPQGKPVLISPVALDLNNDGKIGTTGNSTAQERANATEIGKTVSFDIDADGTKDNIEWFNGDGDGVLVDTSKIKDSGIDGNALFGDLGAKFNNGYERMELLDSNNDGKLSGNELDKLSIWTDDGDAVLEDGELHNLSEFGISDLNTQKKDVENENGEILMQSTATAKGKSILTEDVWFGSEEK